jgi:hypothetical protein
MPDHEVFVSLDREVVNEAVARRDFLHSDHRQRHQIAVNRPGKRRLIVRSTRSTWSRMAVAAG